ncbi:MAG TPA: tRNA (uridine(34)/cytosine(34)/5-carboxymethylaminomethyluridine(34)-2'-O)-methyltransferase TrmL [Planctomycetaceae bacterium]|nr:tRNA (uridine(34)/cytosine(34)/5-carboxymethylaminomethyluridine(34)-2'-O)-methyltransferase TrmL [Planctomycetaceae bacterium]
MSDARLNIVLYQPEIAYNTGSVGRTCVGLGAKLWLVRPLGFQIDDRQLRRAGLDYWPALDWEAVDDWNALTRRLARRRFLFFTKTAAKPYTDVAYESGDVLVFGRESNGLPREMLESRPGQCVRIPIRPEARSLNLSVSVAVAAFEACRQMSLRE